MKYPRMEKLAFALLANLWKLRPYFLLSYDFSYNICIGLFHDKMCCNCINLFSCIFVGFICNGFSI